MNFLPKDYDLEAAWKKVSGPFEHPDFVTHANYLHFMCKSSKNLELKCNLDINKQITLDKRVSQKIKLIELTLDNLKEEKRNIDKYPDYAVVCVSWVPVKSYYLIFNLLILLQYLKSTSNTYLTITHSGLFDSLREALEKKEFAFNIDYFNQAHSVEEIWKWKIPKWENVKRNSTDEDLRYKQIMKKLALYSVEDFKRNKKIKRLVGENKVQFSKSKINLSEFLYWYRIKANYRDMEFVDKGVQVSDFVSFYNDYFELSMNFYLAMKECINSLSQKRANKILLNL